jgi:hypothetical protein
MILLSRRALGLLVLGLATVATAGCGSGDEGRVTVKGKLLQNGEPYIFDESKVKLPKGATGRPPGSIGTVLQVIFIPEEGGVNMPAVTTDKGTFDVVGTDGRGIKPGKYKIAITARYSLDGPDAFNGKFTPERTQIRREVKGPGEEITIDVAKDG